MGQGVLVHFSEANFNDTLPASTVPWIAFISCDSNSTLASFTDDIFALAHSKGAVSAVLYTAYSAGCILDPAYRALPTAQCHPIDIFTVQSKNTARLIETLFSHLPIPGQLSSTDLVTYDAQQLNNAATDIEKSIQSGDPVSSGYLLTTLEGTVMDMPDTVWTSVFTALPTSTTASVVNSTSVSVAAKAESNRGMSLREGFGTYILLFCAFVLHAL
ncbi:hypothetical protein BDN70DRAFT_707874 [Pholiota conissans]|uniref:Uncharacterized protein n=1 Tax=Pholiota conissans TaxID=109636 RepID=A0A9P5ZFS3_9AGAR|nr:hypothetical protein BDN70DRAFT_707874 [Pholiota conissans]